MNRRIFAVHPLHNAAMAIILTALLGAISDTPFAREEADHDNTLLSGAHDEPQRLVGSRVRVQDAQLADGFVAGGEVDLERVTADDLFVAGGSVRLREVVAEDLVVAGGEINLQAQIRDDLLAAGGRIRLDPQNIISGDAVIAGGDVELAGRIDGNVTAAGGRVALAGIIGGDVDVSAAVVIVEPGAKISGRLVYRSGESARISPQAVISGGVHYEATKETRVSRWAVAGFGIGVLLVVLLSMILMAAVLQAVIPGPIEAAVAGFHTRPAMSWMIGFALLVAIPVAANIALLTVVGIPIGLLLYALYAAGLALGTVAVAHELGRIVTRGKRVSADGAVTRSRLGRTALGMLVLSVLALIPLLGWLGLLALIPAGVGAFATECWRRAHAETPALEHA